MSNICSYYKTIWTYGIQLWCCTSKSNIDVIQHFQNIALWIITAAYRLERNNKIHRDNMMVYTIVVKTQRFSCKHKTRLDHHISSLIIKLLDNRRKTRTKIRDVVIFLKGQIDNTLLKIMTVNY